MNERKKIVFDNKPGYRIGLWDVWVDLNLLSFIFCLLFIQSGYFYTEQIKAFFSYKKKGVVMDFDVSIKKTFSLGMVKLSKSLVVNN